MVERKLDYKSLIHVIRISSSTQQISECPFMKINVIPFSDLFSDSCKLVVWVQASATYCHGRFGGYMRDST